MFKRKIPGPLQKFITKTKQMGAAAVANLSTKNIRLPLYRTTCSRTRQGMKKCKGSGMRKKRLNNSQFAFGFVAITVIALFLFLFTYSPVIFDHHIPETSTDSSKIVSCETHGWQRVESGYKESNNFQKPKVWDLVNLNFELDMLDVRLHELDSVVDHFIIVESPVTFSGKPKPLHFSENKERFAKFLYKIIHIVVDTDISLTKSANHNKKLSEQKAKINANNQKSAKLQGLKNAAPDDLIILGGLDEIPRADVTPVELHTIPYMYDFGCREKRRPQWRRAKVARRHQLELDCNGFFLDRKWCVDEMRDNHRPYIWPTSIANAGWHLSSFMSIEQLRTKLGSNMHVQRDTDSVKQVDFLECIISQCLHVNQIDFGERVSIGSPPNIGPKWARTNMQQFYHRKIDTGACTRTGKNIVKGVQKQWYDGILQYFIV